MTRMSAFIAVAIVCSTAAFGQQTGVTGDTCVKLADVVAAGYSVSFSDRQFDAARYYANCEASRSSSSAGLSLAFSVLALVQNLTKRPAELSAPNHMRSAILVRVNTIQRSWYLIRR